MKISLAKILFKKHASDYRSIALVIQPLLWLITFFLPTHSAVASGYDNHSPMTDVTIIWHTVFYGSLLFCLILSVFYVCVRLKRQLIKPFKIMSRPHHHL